LGDWIGMTFMRGGWGWWGFDGDALVIE